MNTSRIHSNSWNRDWNLSQSKVVTFLYVEVFASVGTFIHSTTYISLPCTICYPISLKDNCHPTSPSWIPNRQHVNQIACRTLLLMWGSEMWTLKSIFICCFFIYKTILCSYVLHRSIDIFALSCLIVSSPTIRNSHFRVQTAHKL